MQQTPQEVEILLIPGQVQPIEVGQLIVGLFAIVLAQLRVDRVAGREIAHNEGDECHPNDHKHQPNQAAYHETNPQPQTSEHQERQHCETEDYRNQTIHKLISPGDYHMEWFSVVREVLLYAGAEQIARRMLPPGCAPM